MLCYFVLLLRAIVFEFDLETRDDMLDSSHESERRGSCSDLSFCLCRILSGLASQRETYKSDGITRTRRVFNTRIVVALCLLIPKQSYCFQKV